MLSDCSSCVCVLEGHLPGLQAVRKSKETFKLHEDAQYGSSLFKPADKVHSAYIHSLIQEVLHVVSACSMRLSAGIAT